MSDLEWLAWVIGGISAMAIAHGVLIGSDRKRKEQKAMDLETKRHEEVLKAMREGK